MSAARLTFGQHGKRGGFTLIEILAVVVILGLCSAVILPQLSTHDDSKVASAARTLMSDIIYAQNRAVALQKTHYVVFDTTNNKYDLMTSISPAAIITQPVSQSPYEMVFGTYPLDGVSLGSVSFDGQTILAFNDLGVPQSVTSAGVMQTMNSGSIVIQAKNASITVSVQPYSGEVNAQ
jgi:prepilin-type N-terminal cleavage/methylation domain-containing protein